MKMNTAPDAAKTNPNKGNLRDVRNVPNLNVDKGLGKSTAAPDAAKTNPNKGNLRDVRNAPNLNCDKGLGK